MSPLAWVENTHLGAHGHKPRVGREWGGGSDEVGLVTRARDNEIGLHLLVSLQAAGILVISPDVAQH